MWAEVWTSQTTSFPGRLTEVRTPEAATRLQVRLRVGRLTLGLTVADRWECSQATGLPAWRHQDLSTSQPLGHTVSRALKQKNLYSGTGPGWTLCKSRYTATQGASVVDSHHLGGKNSPFLSDGLTTLTYRCTYPGGQKSEQEMGKQACKHTQIECQTTPRLG